LNRRLKNKINIIFVLYLSGCLSLIQIATTSPELHRFLHTLSFEKSPNDNQNILDKDHKCAVTLLALGIVPTAVFHYDFTLQALYKYTFVENRLSISFQPNKNFNPRDPPKNFFIQKNKNYNKI